MTLRLNAITINKRYDSNEVLSDCSFSFSAQGIYVLTGVNGCGKSTFLRVCALIEEPDRGEINYLFGDIILPKNLELKRRITLVLPKVGVFNTSVYRNAAYGLTIRGIRGAEAEKKVADALAFVGLTQKKDQNALTLSTGEIQRLGIARALVIKPEFLFLDEPTASVDQGNMRIIEDIILTMKRDKMATVVITTHDRGQAKRLADSLLVLENGKISSSG